MNKTASQSADSPLSDKPSSQKEALRAQNRAAFVKYFESGIKTSEPSAIGIELEHFVVDAELQAVAYPGGEGIEGILESLSTSYLQISRNEQGSILGLSRPRENITIEPAAQLEVSAGPFPSLVDAAKALRSFEERLRSILQPLGYHALTLGYHPTAIAAELPLIPKQRYAFMDRYLSSCDSCSKNMMRGSAATQISLDYSSVDDCLRKFKLAYALAPLFSLICDNSPIFEGKLRNGKLRRTHIWLHTDNRRCDLSARIFSDTFSLEDYADFVLDAPAILYQDEEGSWRYTEKSFAELYEGKLMTQAQIEHALSMVFPDVRLKTYLEIRPADSLPEEYALAYAALIKGIFYRDAALEQAQKLLGSITAEDFHAAKLSLMQDGYNAEVYGQSAGKLCLALLDLAAEGLDAPERPFLDPLFALVRSQTTLADLAELKLFSGLSPVVSLPGIEQDGEENVDNTGRMLTVAYKGYFDDGSIFIDQTSTPISFPCVEGWMPPAFIEGTRNLLPGQTSNVRVSADEAYEERTAERIIEIDRSKIPPSCKLVVGEMVNLEQPDGQTYPALLIALDESTATFDMNHDAICKALNFQISLLDAQELPMSRMRTMS